jgi:F-type H+-transporting ATPase subunit a
MDLGEKITEALHFKTIFTLRAGGLDIPITETVIVTWIAMAILIIGSLLLTRNLRKIPQGPQILLEAFVGGINGFAKEQFGHSHYRYAPYIGTVFLFLATANLLPLFSPVGAFGIEPAFSIKPPTRDINLTSALALLSILLVLFSGLRARGIVGWLQRLAHPVPMMIPFNLMEYIVRPVSLSLRLFGNVLGAFIIMRLIEAVAPIGLPPVFSLYFDILDGLIQALVFTFLTSLFVAEAIE